MSCASSRQNASRSSRERLWKSRYVPIGSSALLSAAELHHRPAARFALEQLLELAGQRIEPYRIRNAIEVPRLEIAGEPRPDPASQRHRRRGRVDADQAHAAQYERQHGRME